MADINGSNYNLEFRTKSNEIRHLLVNATTRRDAESNVVGVVGVAQDVTEAVERDVAVRSMARELRQLVDTANAPIFGVDNKGRVNVWNQCAMRLVGYSPEEVMEHSLVEEFITKDYQASVQAVLDQALKGKETANFEFPLMTKAGVRLDVLLNATTRRDEQGNVIGVVGIGQDITG